MTSRAEKIVTVLGAIIFWVIVAVVVVALFKDCSSGPTCPQGQVWVQDPGSPFGDGECQDI